MGPEDDKSFGPSYRSHQRKGVGILCHDFWGIRRRRLAWLGWGRGLVARTTAAGAAARQQEAAVKEKNAQSSARLAHRLAY